MLHTKTVRIILLAITALVLAVGMIYYYCGVLIPIRQKEVQFAGALRGNWSDLYPRWLGARELLWHGRDPYSPEVTREIQRGFYGRPIDSSNRKDPTDPEAFAYPIYVVFLLAPFLSVSFGAVRVGFTVLMLLLTVASVPFWMRALSLPMRASAMALALLATMSSYAVVDGLHLQQITLLVAALMAVAMAALASGRLAMAGVLLALGTVKPQLAIFVIAFLLLWTVAQWQSRKWFAIGFGSVMSAFLVGSELALPGWFHLWLRALEEYVRYHRPSLLAGVFGKPAAVVIGAVAGVACAALFWQCRRKPAGSSQFNFAIVAALALTQLLLPNAGRGAYYNQVLLIPAAVWLFRPGWELSKKSGLACLTWWMAVNVLAWEWILALPPAFAALVLHRTFERETTLLVIGPQLMNFFFPLAIALFVLSAAPQSLQQSEVTAS